MCLFFVNSIHVGGVEPSLTRIKEDDKFVTEEEANFVLITNMNMKYFRPTHNGRRALRAPKKDLFWNKRSRLVILVML